MERAGGPRKATPEAGKHVSPIFAIDDRNLPEKGDASLCLYMVRIWMAKRDQNVMSEWK